MKIAPPFLPIIICLALLLVGNSANANMASPYVDGTKAGSAFSSKHVDILHESIHIRVDENFNIATYTVEYTIKSDKGGKQIPLLFYAVDYRGDFRAWIDDCPVEVSDIPFVQTAEVDSIFFDFSNFKRSKGAWEEYSSWETEIVWQDEAGSTRSYSSCDLKYFQPELLKGIHRIRVEYIANSSLNRSGWINEYTFRYSLAPAKSWRSFGTLDVTVEQDGEIKAYSSSLGLPREGKIGRINTWHFDSLPADEWLELTYKPEPNSYAKVLLLIGPGWLAFAFGVFLFLLHLRAVISHRRRHPKTRFSWVFIVGSLLVPFLALLSFICAYSLIDFAIGPSASHYHGYVMLVMVFYPLILPFYWLIMWLIDRWRRLKSANSLDDG